jgi:hypothetical protein
MWRTLRFQLVVLFLEVVEVLEGGASLEDAAGRMALEGFYLVPDLFHPLCFLSTVR